jgi:dephospho-CoA kinase
LSTILALCGPIGSGKGTVTEYLKQWHNAYVLNAPQLLKELCDVIDAPCGRKNYQKMAVAIGEAFGGEFLLKPLLKRLPRPWPSLVIYDGIRYLAQDTYLRSLSEIKYILVSVDAPADLRYSRVHNRLQYSDESAISRGEFDANMLHPIEHDTPKLMKLAHYHLDNSGTQDGLFEQLQPIIAQII